MTTTVAGADRITLEGQSFDLAGGGIDIKGANLTVGGPATAASRT